MRLTTDKRMRSVWREIYKKKKGTNSNEYLHMIKDPDQAAARLFYCAYIQKFEANMTLNEHLEGRKKIENHALELCAIARDLKGFHPELSERLREIALELRLSHLADVAPRELYLVRRVGDDDLRAYVRTLAFYNKGIFPYPMYNTIATISNVAFDRDDVKASNVRAMVTP